MTLRGTSFCTVAILLAVSCSLGSDLDALTGGAATGGVSSFDASFDGPLEGGKCAPGADCTGCADCMAWCACLVGSNVTQCLAACSGTGGSAGGGGSSNVGGASGSGGTGGTVVSGGGSGGATGGSGGATGGSGGATGGTGGTVGGTGGTAGASGGNPGYTICDGKQCPLATSYCCGNFLSGGTQTCQLIGTSCSYPKAKVYCDGPEDCSNQKCCGSISEAKCAATCSNFILCHANGDCPAGTLCKPSTQLVGIYVCE